METTATNHSQLKHRILILVCSMMFVLVESLSAYWGVTGNKIALLLIFLLGPTAYILFAFITRKNGLAASSIIVNLCIMLGGVLIGLFFYQELITLQQVLGILFAFVAIFLIS